MGTSNEFEESAPNDDLSGQYPVDDLLDPTMSDDDLLLAARLDRPQDYQVPPRPTANQRADWPSPAATKTRSNRLERDPNGMLGGVISGVAYRLGIDVTLARVLTVFAMAFSGGTVIPLYLILWGLLPEAPPTSALARHQRLRRRRQGLSRFFGVMIAFIGAIWMLNILASWATLFVPVGFVALGVWLFWRDRNTADEEDVPLPFTDSMDPLATSVEYQHYIVNKAKRLEQQKRRRNTTIGVTALMATVLAIGAVAGLTNSSEYGVKLDYSEDYETSRLVDIPDQDAELKPKANDQAVSLAKTSSLASAYSVTDGNLRLNLSGADFDEARTISIDATDSDVTITVPPGAPIEYETILTDSNFTDDRIDTTPSNDGSSPLKVVITGSDTEVVLTDY